MVATGKVLDLVSIRAAQDDCLILRPAQNQRYYREYLAVVKVDPINFTLMSEGEQEIILSGFRTFLMSLGPADRLSIHMRTTPYDIQPYLDKLEVAEEQAVSELHRAMAYDHRLFVQRLASERALLQRE